MAKKTDLERHIEELDRLRSKGTINDQEYAARRAALMSNTGMAVTMKKGFPIFRVGCLGIVVVVVLIGIIAAAAGGSKSDDKAAAPSTPGVAGTNKGDVHVPLAEGSSGTIAPERNDNKQSKVTILKIVDNAKSTNQFSTPAAGKKHWAAQVTIENVGTAEVTGLDWKMRDSKDQESSQSFVAGIGESLAGGALTPGGKTTGWVIFTLDADATVKWIRADPNPFLKNDLYFDAAGQ